MEKVISPVSVVYIGNYKVLVKFDNNELKIADLKFLLDKDLKSFEEIKNEDYFKNFTLDECGGINWPNGYDFAPDTLYDIGTTVKAINAKRRFTKEII